MNKDIKIIFVDIDWTILDHEVRDFDHESLDGLRQAQKNGVLVYLCTARPYESILQIKLLDIFEPDGIICTNGGVAFYKNKLIMQNVFPHDIVRQTIEAGKHYGFVVEYGTQKDRYFSIPMNKYVQYYFDTFHEVPCPVKDYEDEDVTSLLLLCPKRFDKRMQKRISKELDYFRFHPFGVDIRYVRNDKGLGIKFVLNYHNFCYDNALSLGDDVQDIFMFKATKYSSYVGNGRIDVQNAANYHAKPVSEHGVLETLKHFEII